MNLFLAQVNSRFENYLSEAMYFTLFVSRTIPYWTISLFFVFSIFLSVALLWLENFIFSDVLLWSNVVDNVFFLVLIQVLRARILVIQWVIEILREAVLKYGLFLILLLFFPPLYFPILLILYVLSLCLLQLPYFLDLRG